MPRDNTRLARLPAEEDHVIVNLVREIDKTLVDVLKKSAQSLDLTGNLGHALGVFFQLGKALDHL